MGLWTKIIKLFLLTVFVLQPSFVWSQTPDDPLKDMTIEEFVETVGFDAETKKNLNPDNDNIIQCGTEFCDLSVNNCYEIWYNNVSYNQGRQYTSEMTTYRCAKYMELENGSAKKVSICYKNCNYGNISFSGNSKKERQYIEKQGHDGNNYRLHIGTNASVQHGFSSDNKLTMFTGCEVLPVKIHNLKKCMFCDLVAVVYDGSVKFTDISLGSIAKSFATLLAIGFAIWIAIQVLGHISSLTKQDAPKFLGNLLRQSYKVLFAIILLYYPQNVFNYAINPLLEAGLDFGNKTLDANSLGEIKKIENKIATGGQGGAFFGEKTYKEIERYVVKIQSSISQLQAVGGSMACVGGRIIGAELNPFTNNKDKKMTHIGDGFSILFQGAVMTIFGFLLSIAFTFYMLDAIVQIAVVGGLLPFIIASWPFKATANYTKTGVNMFMNSVFTLAFIGLIVSIDMQLINEAMIHSATKFSITTDGGTLREVKSNDGGITEIARAFNEQNLQNVLALTDITGMGFLILLVCCYFGFKFLGEASSLANQFASGTLTGKGALAPKIATMGASAAKNLALGATKDFRKAAGDKIGAGMKAVANSPYNLAKAGINKLRNRKSKDKK